MEMTEIMEKRYSVRKFGERKIERKLTEQILQAGRIAPTACNNQPQKILVLESDEAMEKWRKCTRCHFGEQEVLLVCYDRNVSWKREYDGQDSGFVDASIVTTQMMLEAETLGLGSVWVMYFIPEAVRTEFGLPENLIPVSALYLGYPDAEAKPSPAHHERKPVSEIAMYL